MEKSNLIFLIGNEGTGHHLMLDVFPFKNNLKLTELFLAFFDNNQKISKKKKIEKRIVDFFKDGSLSHMEPASFPYYQPRNSLRRYDLVEIFELFKDNSNLNLFFIVLTRDIVDSTLSTYSRFHEKNKILEAVKMQEDNFIFINSQIQLIPKNQWIIVDYQNVCNNIKEFESELQRKLRISDFELDENKIVKAGENKYKKHEYFEFVNQYFNEYRQKQFSFINENMTKF